MSNPKIVVGSKVTIAQEADIKGEVTFGTESVVHPKASILAVDGRIVFGSGCIIEEEAVIINQRKETMRIGDNNLFEVGCRIEAASIGSHNTFEVRSFVGPDVAVESFCTVGAGCSLLASPVWPLDPEDILKEDLEGNKGMETKAEADTEAAASSAEGQTETSQESKVETIPDRTVIFGYDSKRRLWSGEGVKQHAALHAKHLEYLRENVPKTIKLKLIN